MRSDLYLYHIRIKMKSLKFFNAFIYFVKRIVIVSASGNAKRALLKLVSTI